MPADRSREHVNHPKPAYRHASHWCVDTRASGTRRSGCPPRPNSPAISPGLTKHRWSAPGPPVMREPIVSSCSRSTASDHDHQHRTKKQPNAGAKPPPKCGYGLLERSRRPGNCWMHCWVDLIEQIKINMRLDVLLSGAIVPWPLAAHPPPSSHHLQTLLLHHCQ
jgi:hypothetical protein